MAYKIVITSDAEADLDAFLSYLLFVKKNEQAAVNLINDFEDTKNNLANVAGTLKYCDNPKLKALGYKRLNFLSHNYFMLFRIEGNTAIVDSIFHALQDYESKMY